VTLRPERGLWQHSDFLKLWSAETVSQFGTQFSALALPLTAVIVLHASVFEIAALNVVEFLPFVLVSLPAGVWSIVCRVVRFSSSEILRARGS